MANVEDPERIRIALQILQGRYAARKLTSHVIDSQRLGIMFHTDDKPLAAEHGRALNYQDKPKASRFSERMKVFWFQKSADLERGGVKPRPLGRG